MMMRFEDNGQSSLPPGPGMLLLSEPYLFDPNFNRTVVLLCDHNQEGSIGFVLNKPTDMNIDDLLEINTVQQIRVYSGGPVERNTLHFIHRDRELRDSAIKIGHGLYWGGDFEEVQRRIEENSLREEDFRFFLGYSGWGSGQLEGEIDAKSWIVTLADRQSVFETNNEKMWRSILHGMGGAYRFMSNSPENPQMN